MKAFATKAPQAKQDASTARQASPSQNVGATKASEPQAVEFVDNRPEAIAQRKLQKMADTSPQVQRLAQLQATIKSSPRVVAQAKLQARIDSSPRQMAQRKQLECLFGQTVQQQEMLEEDELQMKAEVAPIQRQGDMDEAENRTGMPDNLKAGIEHLSGMAMDDVNVHYNSSKPAQLQALAYTQGTDIHVGPSQERHLPHEAWHVVQQKQGRVKPTLQSKGVTINDDAGLEHEADVMGTKALQMRRSEKSAFEFPIHGGDYQNLANTFPNVQRARDAQTKADEKAAETAQLSSNAPIQMGNDPIDPNEGQKFKYGLIHGTYVPARNEADMHVSPRSDEVPFSPRDVYNAFTFLKKKMAKERKSSGTEGTIIWNPQGAAVIKMVAELMGEALGNPEVTAVAKELKISRKAHEGAKPARDMDVLSDDIVPEHLSYMRSMTGSGADIRPVLPGSTEDTFDQNMLSGDEAGNARMQEYAKALEDGIPVSLRIQITQTQLDALIETMKAAR